MTPMKATNTLVTYSNRSLILEVSLESPCQRWERLNPFKGLRDSFGSAAKEHQRDPSGDLIQLPTDATMVITTFKRSNHCYF